MAKRRKTPSRILSVFIAVALIISMLASSVYAGEPDIPSEENGAVTAYEIENVETQQELFTETGQPGTGDQAPEDTIEVLKEEPEEPVAEEPKAEEPAAEEPKAEEPAAEEPKAEEPVVEEPKAEEPVVEEPKAEEPAVEEPKAEEPAVEEPKAEEPAEKEPVTVDITSYTASAQIQAAAASVTDATPTQAKILASAAKTVPAQAGYCAMWVESVYAGAGIAISGNACDLWAAYCNSNNRVCGTERICR